MFVDLYIYILIFFISLQTIGSLSLVWGPLYKLVVYSSGLAVLQRFLCYIHNNVTVVPQKVRLSMEHKRVRPKLTFVLEKNKTRNLVPYNTNYKINVLSQFGVSFPQIGPPSFQPLSALQRLTTTHARCHPVPPQRMPKVDEEALVFSEHVRGAMYSRTWSRSREKLEPLVRTARDIEGPGG